MKDKKTILELDLMSKTCTVIGLFCLGSITGAVNMVISFFVILVLNIRESRFKGSRWVGLFVVVQLGYVLSALCTYAGISSILIFMSCTNMLIANWFLSPQKMRIVGGLNSFIYLGYQISIRNWAGLVEIAVIICNFASFVMHKEKRKQR